MAESGKRIAGFQWPLLGHRGEGEGGSSRLLAEKRTLGSAFFVPYPPYYSYGPGPHVNVTRLGAEGVILGLVGAVIR